MDVENFYQKLSAIDTEIIDQFIIDLHNMADGKRRHVSLKHSLVQASLHMYNDFCYFNRLTVSECIRQSGYGKAILQLVTLWADERNMLLILNAQPSDNKIPLLGLMMMYEKHGFSVVENIYKLGQNYLTMKRQPSELLYRKIT